LDMFLGQNQSQCNCHEIRLKVQFSGFNVKIIGKARENGGL
jgi:hypothetical protein